MKINSITNNSLTNYRIKQNKKPQQTAATNTINNTKLPSMNGYFAFLGGYSVSLEETYQKFTPKDYPPDIKENIETALVEDPEKTLKDIHLEKYKGVLDCYSLDELKEKYPEFKEVKSAYEVQAVPESFIGRFQNDESELFSTGEDLSLQLIKLYWGQGLSLNDLADYVQKNSSTPETKNLYYAMHTKLNIPIMSTRYGAVLKLSDKEYNEKFTKILSEKIQEAKDRRCQQRTGEPVYIPQGPLSQAHKQHISEGLKKYYSENPSKIYEMSERQKAYWQENPKEKERFSKVLDYAWNKTHEGKTIKKELSKFARKFNRTISEKQMTLSEPLSKEDKSLLTAFWKNNDRNKAKFSTAVQKGYAYHTKMADEYFSGVSREGKIFFAIIPSVLAEQVSKYAKTKGIDLSPNQLKLSCVDSDPQEYGKKIIDHWKLVNNLIDEYEDKNPEIPDRLANARLFTLVDFKNRLEHGGEGLPKSFRQNKKSIDEMNHMLDLTLASLPIYVVGEDGKKYPRLGVTNDRMEMLYQFIMEYALKNNNIDINEYLEKTIDKYYGELRTSIRAWN